MQCQLQMQASNLGQTTNLPFPIFHVSIPQIILRPHSQANIYPYFNVLNSVLLLQDVNTENDGESSEYF
jgi:hypothetical protein